MAAVFESRTLGPTERLVMLALADHADEEGKCYPSMQRLCERTGLSERAVQMNVKRLVEAGYLRVSVGGGKGNANLYFVSPNPASDAPRTKCTPAPDAPQTPHQMRANPAPDAPEPSGTTIEPSDIGRVPRAKPRKPEVPLPPDWVPNDRNLADAEARQFSTQEIEDEADRFRNYHTAKGNRFRDWDAAWRTWLGNARRFARPAPQGGKRADAAIEQIARLAGLGAAPGDGRGRAGGLGEEAGPLWMGTRPQ